MLHLSWWMIPVFNSARDVDFKRKHLSDAASGSDPSTDMRRQESHFSSSELTPPLDNDSFAGGIWCKGEGKWRLVVRATLRMISVPLSDGRLAKTRCRSINFCLEAFLHWQNSKGHLNATQKTSPSMLTPSLKRVIMSNMNKCLTKTFSILVCKDTKKSIFFL